MRSGAEAAGATGDAPPPPTVAYEISSSYVTMSVVPSDAFLRFSTILLMHRNLCCLSEAISRIPRGETGGRGEQGLPGLLAMPVVVACSPPPGPPLSLPLPSLKMEQWTLPLMLLLRGESGLLAVGERE